MSTGAHLLETNLSRQWPANQWSGVTTLIATSGGPDSVALLRALVRVRPEAAPGRLVVAHYNHRWRGEESDRDQHFVQDLARSMHLRCEIGMASDSGTFASEDAARKQRYGFLLETAHSLGARYVALAHTRDDQAETILFRLLRGTGMSGLTGMPQTRPLSDAATLVRPLLEVRRSAVLDYLQHLGQSYCVDSSNTDIRYARNRLRYETLPALQSASAGDVVEKLVHLGLQAGELLAPIRQEARRLVDVATQQQGEVCRIHLARLPESIERAVLRELFVEIWKDRNWPRGEMTFERWDELAEMVGHPHPPPGMYPGSVRVEKRGEVLRLQRGVGRALRM